MPGNMLTFETTFHRRNCDPQTQRNRKWIFYNNLINAEIVVMTKWIFWQRKLHVVLGEGQEILAEKRGPLKFRMTYRGQTRARGNWKRR